ncbi:MAG: response regulator transcription factor [Deltaproteobacteria bacterium]|nr:response regulator transcription factor [Deltaproteobacteria bacterium]
MTQPPGQPKKKVLVIEDEPDIVRGLKDALEFEDYDVFAAFEGKDGVRLARERSPDLVILDLMLPDVNGYQVCVEIRGFNSVVPIIILTARGQESDKIRGLEAGADDYVTKPFSVGELLARIRAIFRRMSRTPAGGETLRIGEATIDVKKQTVTIGRKRQPLTFYEVELLKLLYERAEQPVSRDEILDKIWGVEAYPTNRTVDNFIVKLRRKLEDDTKKPTHILTVYGYGYKLVP